jgi:hypothetical protein
MRNLLALSIQQVFFGLIILIIPIYLIYKYGKNKGRLEELEKRVKENEREKKS